MPYKIFGCKVNKFYINQRLEYYQHKNKDLKNTLLIATCVVTDRAKSKRIKEAEKALKSWMQVAITWCGTLQQGKLISRTDFFSIYPELSPYSEWIELLGETPQSPERATHHNIGQRPMRTKHFIMIQNGCDNHCSFCLTVLKRWPHRSRALEDIIEEIKLIEAQGGKEIVLTWVNLMARGANNTRKPEESRFPELLEAILKQTTIPRIRISSIGPEYANDHFFEVISDKRILPHFHYSIQSFSDRVLKLMKRNYDVKLLDRVLKKTHKILPPARGVESRQWSGRGGAISIWADIIVGFPGETESDFLETLNGIETYGITKLHAFPFSDHHKGETIPASSYPNQVTQSTKQARVRELITKGDEMREKFITANKGIPHQILIEEKRNGKRRGRTENYIQVELEGDYKKGEIISYML